MTWFWLKSWTTNSVFHCLRFGITWYSHKQIKTISTDPMSSQTIIYMTECQRVKRFIYWILHKWKPDKCPIGDYLIRQLHFDWAYNFSSYCAYDNHIEWYHYIEFVHKHKINSMKHSHCMCVHMHCKTDNLPTSGTYVTLNRFALFDADFQIHNQNALHKNRAAFYMFLFEISAILDAATVTAAEAWPRFMLPRLLLPCCCCCCLLQMQSHLFFYLYFVVGSRGQLVTCIKIIKCFMPIAKKPNRQQHRLILNS